MAGNPRIEELRKKLDKEPGSRLFAQLAEELRKDGEFEDAIRVAREGLQKHQNYPSARLTLGRALFDTGDWAAARVEFEQVLKGAPDNILASRLLSESLESLGDVPAAIARYKKTLALAPGDKQVLARLEALEGGGSGRAAVAVPAPAAASPAAGIRPPGRAVVAAPPVPPEPPPIVDTSAPIRLVEVDTPMELERPHERGSGETSTPEPVMAAPAVPEAAPAASPGPPPPAPPPAPPPIAASVAAPAASTPEPASAEPAPIPLAAADESFEIERPNEAPRPTVAEPPAAAHPAPPPVAAPAPRSHEPAMEFEFEPGPTGATIPFAPPPAAAPPSAAVAETPMPADKPVPVAASAPAPPPPMEEARTIEMPSPSPVTAAPPFPSPASAVEAAPATPPAPPAGPAPAREAEAASGELMSATLAELYFNQGFTDRAIEVYRHLLDRDPDNDRLRRRLQELQAPATMPPTPAVRLEPPAPPVPAPMVAAPPFVAPAPAYAEASAASAAPAPSPDAARRASLERTIARLEGMLAAIKKG